MKPYQYVVLRCVPKVEREEFINVGVILACEDDDFLGFESHVEPTRLAALAPEIDLDAVRQGLEFVTAVCRADSAAGAVADKSPSIRFGFLKAPRSTVLQPGPVHGGITSDPGAELLRLVDRIVR